jgi:hypothetical protein
MDETKIHQGGMWRAVNQASSQVAKWESWKRRYVVDIFYETRLDEKASVEEANNELIQATTDFRSR